MTCLTCGIQEIDLEGQGAENAFPRIQILHSGSVSFAETLAEQSTYNGALADPGATEHHQPDPLEIGHVLRLIEPVVISSTIARMLQLQEGITLKGRSIEVFSSLQSNIVISSVPPPDILPSSEGY